MLFPTSKETDAHHLFHSTSRSCLLSLSRTKAGIHNNFTKGKAPAKKSCVTLNLELVIENNIRINNLITKILVLINNKKTTPISSTNMPIYICQARHCNQIPIIHFEVYQLCVD